MIPSFKCAPVLEHDLVRTPGLGYELTVAPSLVRCIEHGSPTPLERWHCHDEYELHLIVAGHGLAFVGDYTGHFETGHLVFTGPRLPHNWISTDLPTGGHAVRSLGLQIRDELLQRGLKDLGVLGDVEPLLARSRHGVEFFGLSDHVRQRIIDIRTCYGVGRLSRLLDLLCTLAQWPDYRLLSSDRLQCFDGDAALSPLNRVVEFVEEHYSEAISLSAMSRLIGMTESRFSRYFIKMTGYSFTDYVTQTRVGKACEMLIRSDLKVSKVCDLSGFNNLANFNRRFLRLKGVTPTEYRRQAMLCGVRPVGRLEPLDALVI